MSSNRNSHRDNKKSFQAWLPQNEQDKVEIAKVLLGVKTDRELLNLLMNTYFEGK